MENRDTSAIANWHSMSANTALEELKCSTEGLTQTEAETRFV